MSANKFINETNNSVVNCRVQWTDAMTKLLLAEMQKHAETFTNPGKLNINTWKNITASINTYGYNLTSDNCYIKWIGMKKKYKSIKDAINQTGTEKQSWEYFDVINDMLGKNPAIVPLSIASNIRGFEINQNISPSSDEEHYENEQNKLNIASTNVLKNRRIRKRKSKTSVWMEELIEQRERHHRENYTQRERLLSLLAKDIKTKENDKTRNNI
ncbi:PREDICTED: uncharacterized protein LOC108778299 [Cyphomyrmex costatus]|uniref:Uncharacterized protein n=1 Tax=Cyphomyrmex costatus TaxID=456900 RepID=A0A151IPG1_9HYME|nr:PREDICTED: uncharacterized protein LOC108778299 [Cyphomyrmex costatus]KYN07864.1 hypothetical protein ALC62_01162 [Cyphomyrmex costatus]